MKLPTFASPLKLFAPAPSRPALGAAGIGGNLMFASSGGSGGDYDPDEYDEIDDQPVQRERGTRATRSSRPGGGDNRDTTGGRPRTAQYQPEERYWTDYLRIALPVIGLLLMIGLLWFWADRLINDDSTTDPTATEEVGLVITTTPTPPPVGIQGSPPPGDTNAPGQSTPAPGSDASQDDAQTPPPPETDQSEEGEGTDDASFADGDTVTAIEEINLRPDPSTSGEPIAILEPGETLTIAGGPEEGEDYVWWEVVTEDGTTGWVVEDFIEAAE